MPGTVKIPDASKLTSELYHLAAIVGRLGLSIASAQKAFNADYVAQIERLVQITSDVVPTIVEQGSDEQKKKSAEILLKILTALAPPRYQYTETTIEFSADLAETFDVGIQGTLGVGTKAITVNAGMTLGYGYDYRAAARIKSVIHAMPVDSDLVPELLNRAKEIDGGKLNLPAPKSVDQEIWDGLKNLHAVLGGGVLPDSGGNDTHDG